MWIRCPFCNRKHFIAMTDSDVRRCVCGASYALESAYRWNADDSLFDTCDLEGRERRVDIMEPDGTAVEVLFY